MGLASVRANAVPIIVLWLAAAALIAGYGLLPSVRAVLDPLAHFQRRCGFWAGFASQFVFCGLIPCVFRLTVRTIRTDHPILKSLLQSVWNGCWGIVYVGFYAFQGRLFGTGTDFGTVVVKTLFDEFLWAPLVPVPATAFFCLWMESGFSLRSAVTRFGRHFVRQTWLANVVTNWIVWMAPALAIYAFPPALQVQVLGLVGSIWALISLSLAKETSA